LVGVVTIMLTPAAVSRRVTGGGRPVREGLYLRAMNLAVLACFRQGVTHPKA